MNKLIYVLQFVVLWNQRDFKTNLTGLLWIRASLVAQLVKNPPAMQETWIWSLVWEDQGFPGGLAGKASTCNAGDLGSIPESGRSPGEGNGNPLQYSCLENPMDRGAWEESDVTERILFTLLLGRSGKGKRYPLQYSDLQNSMDSPWGSQESDTTERLSLYFASLYCE